MKKIMSLAIVLVALIGITTAFTLHNSPTDNAKWTKDPCVSKNTIIGMATGLGTGPYELHVTGYYDCVNNGKNTPGSDNWSELDVYIPINPKQQGGNFKISADIPPQCDHANWTFLTKDLQCTLTQNGYEVIGATDISANCY